MQGKISRNESFFIIRRVIQHEYTEVNYYKLKYLADLTRVNFYPSVEQCLSVWHLQALHENVFCACVRLKMDSIDV